MKKRFLIVAKCLDKKGKLLASATNTYTKSHPIQKHFAILANQPERDKLHAEISALLRAKDKSIRTIQVERYNADGSPALARPCPVCSAAIKAFGVRQIIYTDESGFVKETVE